MEIHWRKDYTVTYFFKWWTSSIIIYSFIFFILFSFSFYFQKSIITFLKNLITKLVFNNYNFSIGILFKFCYVPAMNALCRTLPIEKGSPKLWLQLRSQQPNQLLNKPLETRPTAEYDVFSFFLAVLSPTAYCKCICNISPYKEKKKKKKNFYLFVIII